MVLQCAVPLLLLLLLLLLDSLSCCCCIARVATFLGCCCCGLHWDASCCTNQFGACLGFSPLTAQANSMLFSCRRQAWTQLMPTELWVCQTTAESTPQSRTFSRTLLSKAYSSWSAYTSLAVLNEYRSLTSCSQMVLQTSSYNKLLVPAMTLPLLCRSCKSCLESIAATLRMCICPFPPFQCTADQQPAENRVPEGNWGACHRSRAMHSPRSRVQSELS